MQEKIFLRFFQDISQNFSGILRIRPEHIDHSISRYAEFFLRQRCAWNIRLRQQFPDPYIAAFSDSESADPGEKVF